jgi:hypothetical protein
MTVSYTMVKLLTNINCVCFSFDRFDHYQMGPSVVVSIYAKLCDPQKCFVEANYTCVSTLVTIELLAVQLCRQMTFGHL